MFAFQSWSNFHLVILLERNNPKTKEKNACRIFKLKTRNAGTNSQTQRLIKSVVLFVLNRRCLAVVGLTLIAVGTGGIKPCVATFGGDQFQLPEQQDQLARFFSRFITAIYVGALISTFFTPELRRGVQCFGRDTCFPLAFGVLSLLMISSLGGQLVK